VDRLVELFLSNFGLMSIVFEVVDSNQLDFSNTMAKFTREENGKKFICTGHA